MSNSTTRVGLAGVGYVGLRHISNLLTMGDVEIVGAHDPSAVSAEFAQKTYAIEMHSDLASLLDAGLDALLICSPPSGHLMAVKLAAQRGTHVFCEKPLSASLEECKEMIAICEEHQVKLMVGLKKRFDPYYAASKRIFDDSGDPPKFATVKFFNGRVDKDWYWAENDAAGPVVETAGHMYDMLEAWFGPIERVYAEGGTLFRPERAPVPDVAAVTFRFRSGAIAMMGLGYATERSIARESVQLASDRFVVQVEGVFDWPDQMVWLERDRPAEINSVEIGGSVIGSGLREEMEHFIDVVRGDKDLVVTGANGLRAVEIGLAVRESIQTGMPITLGQ